MNYETLNLKVGTLRIYRKDDKELICYETKDPISDQVILYRVGDDLISIEAPLFKENVNELNEYIRSLNCRNLFILLSDHVASKNYLSEAKLLTTNYAINNLRSGGAKALFDGFVQAFGEGIESELRDDYNLVEDTLNFEDYGLRLSNKVNSFDIFISEFSAVYTHMLGHDVHSIIGGKEHASFLLNELETFKKEGVKLVLSSHYIPESIEDVDTKIDYINRVVQIASTSTSREEFKKKVKKEFLNYLGDNYLDITSSSFFAK